VEVFRALGVLVEAPTAEHARLARLLGLPGTPLPHEHTDLFVLNLYPYASVYTGDEGMIGGEAQDRAAGLWRALHLVPPAEPDHLTALLALHATIIDRERTETDPARRALWRQARKACLWEHLASWLFPYLDKLEEVAPPAYQVWGRLLRDAVSAEIVEMGPADRLPLHLRQATPLAGPDDAAGAETWIGALLAPIRSGMIITRADLARAAADAGLGLRAGERRFALKALLAQDAGRVLRWLAAEAEIWIDRHGRQAAVTGAVGRFWQARARAAASMLATLGIIPS
jgi:TorA maturation chaperone TorD